jgi:CheY-like chemotaxis protein
MTDMTDTYIMLVEDNEDDEALILRALKHNHIRNRVVIAHDGQEALDRLLGTVVPFPALVLLDLKLPKVDGLEVLRRLRADERTKLLPVVILTSSKEQEDVVNGYRFGCNSYVQKPVDFLQLVEAARQLGLYWLILNEPPPLGGSP